MGDTIVNLAAARAASDRNTADLHAAVKELCAAGDARSQAIQKLEVAVLECADMLTISDLCRGVVEADDRVKSLCTETWNIGHRRIGK